VLVADEGVQVLWCDPATSDPADAEKWRRWWMIPLWIGVGIVVVSGLFMLWAFQASGLGFWFFCTSVFLALGLVILVLAAQSRSARWLHLRRLPSPSPASRPDLHRPCSRGHPFHPHRSLANRSRR